MEGKVKVSVENIWNKWTTIFRPKSEYQTEHTQGKTHRHHRAGHKHGQGSAIDFYAYVSNIRHWNPAFKVVFAVTILLLCIILNSPYVSVAVILAMAYLTVIKGGIPIPEYLSILMIPIVFILLSTVTIGVDFSNQPLGEYNLSVGFGYLYTSKIKLMAMVFLILKVFGAISAMEMMTLSTPSTEIISVLRKARVPKLIVELMNLIYRYIFILLDVYAKMKNSADSRQGYCDFKTSCYTFGSVASNMLVVSLKKANAYYNAMEARCYDGDLLFLEEDKKATKIQIICGAAFIVFLVLLWIFT